MVQSTVTSKFKLALGVVPAEAGYISQESCRQAVQLLDRIDEFIGRPSSNCLPYPEKRKESHDSVSRCPVIASVNERAVPVEIKICTALAVADKPSDAELDRNPESSRSHTKFRST
jgi:hypothetical protein